MGEGMSTPSGVDLGARVRRVCASLSEPQLRVVFAAVDVLTCIKKWNTRPTATLVQRKVQNALAQLEGDEEALCFLVESAFLKAGVRLDSPELEGVSRAVRGSHMTDVAEELALVHVRELVCDIGQVTASHGAPHAVKLQGVEAHARLQERGLDQETQRLFVSLELS